MICDVLDHPFQLGLLREQAVRMFEFRPELQSLLPGLILSRAVRLELVLDQIDFDRDTSGVTYD